MHAGRVSAPNLIALPFIGFVIPQKCFDIAKECLRERLAMWFTKLFHLLSCCEMISFSFTLSERNETFPTGLDFGFSKAPRRPCKLMFMLQLSVLHVCTK